MKSHDIRLSDLLARTIEEGDCLIWAGYANKGKFPQWRIGGHLWLVRRLIWSLSHEAMPRGQVGTHCGSPLCVHPNCLVDRSRAKAQRGILLTASHKANIATGRRAKSRLTMDVVREIRASDEPSVNVDRRLGLSIGYTSRIRLGLAWKDRASPFSGLGAQ